MRDSYDSQLWRASTEHCGKCRDPETPKTRYCGLGQRLYANPEPRSPDTDSGGTADSPACWRKNRVPKNAVGKGVQGLISLSTILANSHQHWEVYFWLWTSCLFYCFPNFTPKLAPPPGRSGGIAPKGPPKAQIITFLGFF